MAIAPDTNIGTLISTREGVNGGRPCIAGTGISVQNIAILHNQGARPEEIARRKSLTLAHVHAALAYYYANKEKIDVSIAMDRAEQEWRRTPSVKR